MPGILTLSFNLIVGSNAAIETAAVYGFGSVGVMGRLSVMFLTSWDGMI